MKTIKNYTDLIKLKTYEDRVNYLRLYQNVGEDTFGSNRFINQRFYKSEEWKQICAFVINRDDGNDLAINDRKIIDSILVHHMKPITILDLKNRTKYLLDPEFLISTSLFTHNLIHFGAKNFSFTEYSERKPNDTRLW